MFGGAFRLSAVVLFASTFPNTAAAQGAEQQSKLIAGDGAVVDQFGVSVSVSGDTAVIGANLDDDAGDASGAVYVFARNGATWSEQAKLTASDAAAGDEFGGSVAVSGDTIVAGARHDDDAGSSSGSAYVFVRSGTTWSEEAKLTASDAAVDDWFGCAVAVNGDTIVVGARFDDDAGGFSGSAYVFVRSGTTWSQQAKLTANDAAAADQFGSAVAVSGESTLIGAPFRDDAGNDSGAAYVFVRSGTIWNQEAKLIASDAAADDRLGESVSISAGTGVVGARAEDGVGVSSGAAYVFVRSGTIWSEQAKLTASDAATADQFGGSVAVDGNSIVVGAVGDDDGGAISGSAYAFMRSGATWSEHAKLTASDAGASDQFGFSVALSGDTAVCTAPFDDDAGSNSGSAYAFVICGTLAQYGAGLAGSGGFVPTMTGNGCPRLGETIDIEITGGLGGAQGCMLFGFQQLSFPLFGGTVLVNPLVCLTHSLGGAGAGNGTRTFSLTIPVKIDYVGQDFYFQSLYIDAGAVQGASFTNGVNLRSN